MTRFGLPPNRLLSLDAFRGLTIAAMILVNNPGSWAHVYAPLRHAVWHGWTPTDLIFPFFLFIMGIAMALTDQRRAATTPWSSQLQHLMTRSVLLILLGLVLNLYPNFDLGQVRYMGVLQRIGVCYFTTSLIIMSSRKMVIRHVLIAGLLTVYLALIYLFPTPEFGAGSLARAGNAGAYFDQMIFGARHLYQGGPFDPEGLLTTLPAILSTWLGFLFGRVLVISDDHSRCLQIWLRHSIILIIVGVVFSLAIPINKQLWTPSYAIFTAGMAGIFFSICYWLIEVHNRSAWFKPFIMLGLNPLIIFWLSGMVVRTLSAVKVATSAGELSLWNSIYHYGFISWLPDYPASLIFALTNVVCWIFLAWYLWSKKWFIRL